MFLSQSSLDALVAVCSTVIVLEIRPDGPFDFDCHTNQRCCSPGAQSVEPRETRPSPLDDMLLYQRAREDARTAMRTATNQVLK